MDLVVLVFGMTGLLGGAAVGWLLVRARQQRETIRALEIRVEDLSDRNWELRDSAERARSLLQAQDDLIVRRDADGIITYANESYCALAECYANVVGSDFKPIIMEQREELVLPDGSLQTGQFGQQALQTGA